MSLRRPTTPAGAPGSSSWPPLRPTAPEPGAGTLRTQSGSMSANPRPRPSATETGPLPRREGRPATLPCPSTTSAFESERDAATRRSRPRRRPNPTTQSRGRRANLTGPAAFACGSPPSGSNSPDPTAPRRSARPSQQAARGLGRTGPRSNPTSRLPSSLETPASPERHALCRTISTRSRPDQPLQVNIGITATSG